MERVAILGSGGAGKSELAVELSKRTGLPAVHLDLLYWAPGWVERPQDEFRAALDAAVAEDQWILDGNVLRDDADDPRFARADTVVFLDVRRSTCLWRAVRRRVRDRGRRRADLPEGCLEGWDLPFLRWVWGYPKYVRPRVLRILAGLNSRVSIHHLRSNADVRRFLESV